MPHERAKSFQCTEIPVVLNVPGTGQMAVPQPIMWPEDDPWETTLTYTIAPARDDEDNGEISYIVFFGHSKDYPINPVVARMKLGVGIRGPVVIMAYNAMTRRFRDLNRKEEVLHAFDLLKR